MHQSTSTPARPQLQEPDIASAKLSLEEDVKVSYDYNQNKENYNSNYSERTITQTEQTDHDDKLLGRTQTLDIWRYRVYGQAGTDPNGQPSNVFYEVVLPGPTLTFDSGGQNWTGISPRMRTATSSPTPSLRPAPSRRPTWGRTKSRARRRLRGRTVTRTAQSQSARR